MLVGLQNTVPEKETEKSFYNTILETLSPIVQSALIVLEKARVISTVDEKEEEVRVVPEMTASQDENNFYIVDKARYDALYRTNSNSITSGFFELASLHLREKITSNARVQTFKSPLSRAEGLSVVLSKTKDLERPIRNSTITSEQINAEAEEKLFRDISTVIKTTNQKLKSKLRPENIGLIIPGEFLPCRNRILKDKVAVAICEKSNNEYTWKDPGEPVFVKKKKSGKNLNLSRNIRPKNRIEFAQEDVFHSAWETSFYKTKCKEILDNETAFLEMPLVAGSKRSLSSRKMEVNKRKRSLATRDNFYYGAFNNSQRSYEESSAAVLSMRQEALDDFFDFCQRGKMNVTTDTIKAEDLQLQQSLNLDENVYFNSLIGIVKKPKFVIKTESEIMSTVTTTRIGFENVKEQFSSEPDDDIQVSANDVKLLPLHIRPKIALPAYRREGTDGIADFKFDPLSTSLNRLMEVNRVLQRLIFKLTMDGVSRHGFGQMQSQGFISALKLLKIISNEDTLQRTDDNFYQVLHEKFCEQDEPDDKGTSCKSLVPAELTIEKAYSRSNFGKSVEHIISSSIDGGSIKRKRASTEV